MVPSPSIELPVTATRGGCAPKRRRREGGPLRPRCVGPDSRLRSEKPLFSSLAPACKRCKRAGPFCIVSRGNRCECLSAARLHPPSAECTATHVVYILRGVQSRSDLYIGLTFTGAQQSLTLLKTMANRRWVGKPREGCRGVASPRCSVVRLTDFLRAPVAQARRTSSARRSDARPPIHSSPSGTAGRRR